MVSMLWCMQLVPVPRKRRLQYLEPQALGTGSLQLRLQQALFRAEVRLACVQRRATLVAKEAELGRLLKLPAESQPVYVREFDSQSTRANTQRLGLWLGNSLNHCLFSQGPFCAAILLKARPHPPNEHARCTLARERSFLGAGPGTCAALLHRQPYLHACGHALCASARDHIRTVSRNAAFPGP